MKFINSKFVFLVLFFSMNTTAVFSVETAPETNAASVQNEEFKPIGVPECDAIVVKFNECFKKLPQDEGNPEGFRVTVRNTVREIMTGWVEVMKTLSPALICAKTHENFKAKPFMEQFGCTY